MICFQIAEGFPPNDVTLMRKALSLDGWLKEESLPEGWRVKRFSKNNLAFVTDRGNLLRSQLEAINYISTHLDSYTMSEIDQIKKYMTEIKDWVKPKKKPKKLKLWKEDQCLPEGWNLRTKISGNRSNLEVKSPDGEKFSDFKSVYQHLTKAGRKEAVLLLEKLLSEGYVTNPSLPEGWLVKNTGARLVSILTTEGLELKSYKAALEHIQADDGYDEENVEDLRMLIDESKKKLRTKGKK